MLRKPTTEDLDLLSELSEMLTLIDRDQLLDRVVELTCASFGAERASLLLNPQAPDDWPQVLVRYVRGEIGVLHEDSHVSVRYARRVLQEGLAGWVLREQRGVVISDTTRDDRWVTFEDSTSAARSVLCVPFVSQRVVLGVLTLLHSDAGAFDEGDLQLLMIIANQTATALLNARLFHRMQQKEQQLEAVLSALPDALLVLDEQTSVLMANEGAAGLIGLPLDQIVKQRLIDLIASDGVLQRVLQVVAAPLQTGQSWSFDVRSETHGRDYMVGISIWQSAQGGAAGYVVVLRDVSNLRDLNRFKDEMLHIASHDMRSPLALITGYCSLIELDAPPDSPIQDYLQAIQKSTGRMQGLLDDLLRAEKIRTSPLEMVEAIDLADLIHSALNDARPQFDARRQVVDADLLLEGAPRLSVNGTLIRESIFNYLDNASKYTPEGGRIEVRSWIDGDRVYVAVRDSGIGMPPESMSRVFEAFYRAHHPNTIVEGRGLGLHLVKTVIERHRGQVWVSSEPGQGSEFGLWLPLTEAV